MDYERRLERAKSYMKWIIASGFIGGMFFRVMFGEFGPEFDPNPVGKLVDYGFDGLR